MNFKVLNMADMTAAPDALAPLKDLAKVVSLPPDQDSLKSNIGGFDAYFASLHIQMTKEILDKAKRLRVIATSSTGTDHIDVKYAAEKKIVIISLKEDTEFLDKITATAEMTWTLLLAVIRRLPWAFTAAQSGRWARDEFRGHQLAGKTLGILGYGRLGRIVAEYGKAFRMKVLACDVRKVKPAAGITLVNFETLIKESDVFSLHIHLTNANQKLINADVLSRMKRDAILINTSRGAIIDEAALLSALLSGKIAGAGVDVIDGEWNQNLIDHPLIRYAREHQNLVISPHIGGVTFESQAMTLRYTAEKLAEFLKLLKEMRK